MSLDQMAAQEHFEQAVAALERAEAWMDADHGWQGNLDQDERLRHRMADLAEAQVHASLAHAAAQLYTANRVELVADRVERQ